MKFTELVFKLRGAAQDHAIRRSCERRRIRETIDDVDRAGDRGPGFPSFEVEKRKRRFGGSFRRPLPRSSPKAGCPEPVASPGMAGMLLCVPPCGWLGLSVLSSKEVRILLKCT